MRKSFYTFIAILSMGLGAYAEEAVPTQLQIYGSDKSSVNGTTCSWATGKQVSVDVVDGTAVLNFQNPIGSYTISTCTKDETNWGNINGSRLAIPSTATADYLKAQDVTTDVNVTFASGEKNVTVVFSDNLTKVTILPGILYCVGDNATTINNETLDWSFDKAIEVTAENGVFTLDADWKGSLYVTYLKNNWGKGVVGEGYVTAPRTTIPADKLNQALPVVLNSTNPQPTYVSETPYTIIISQDLKTIEYKVALRSFQLEVRDGYYDQAPVYYDMETTDGVTYSYKFTDTVPAGRTITIVDKNHKNNLWRLNGEIALGTEENWGTSGGNTPSNLKEGFIGTVTAVMPVVEGNLNPNNDKGEAHNQYSGQQAAVTFTKDPTTGIEGITVNNRVPVEYFNLQGVRVANPENGVFIRRQGSKVSKVFVK